MYVKRRLGCVVYILGQAGRGSGTRGKVLYSSGACPGR
jgi:hypothetical protein